MKKIGLLGIVVLVGVIVSNSVGFLASLTQVLQYFGIDQKRSSEVTSAVSIKNEVEESRKPVIQFNDSPNYGNLTIQQSFDKQSYTQLKEIEDRLKTTRSSRSEESETKLRIPGFSFNSFVRLRSKGTSEPAFIWDMGVSEFANRFSIYLDRSNNLCCRYIDTDGEEHLLKVSPDTDTFLMEKFFYLNCDLAKVGDGSILTLRVDGRTLDRHELLVRPVDDTFSLDTAILGADMTHLKAGVFDLGIMITFSETLRSEDLQIISEVLHKFPSKNVLTFSGKNWFRGESLKKLIDDIGVK